MNTTRQVAYAPYGLLSRILHFLLELGQPRVLRLVVRGRLGGGGGRRRRLGGGTGVAAPLPQRGPAGEVGNVAVHAPADGVLVEQPLRLDPWLARGRVGVGDP